MIKTAEQIMSGWRMPPGWVPPEPVRRGRPPLNRVCDLPDCDRKHRSGGFCQKHLDAFRSWGDPYHVFKPGRFQRCICPKHPWGAVRGSHQNSRPDPEGQAQAD